MVSNSVLAAFCFEMGLYTCLDYDNRTLSQNFTEYVAKLTKARAIEEGEAAREGRPMGQYWSNIEEPKVSPLFPFLRSRRDGEEESVADRSLVCRCSCWATSSKPSSPLSWSMESTLARSLNASSRTTTDRSWTSTSEVLARSTCVCPSSSHPSLPFIRFHDIELLTRCSFRFALVARRQTHQRS
jgi:hypothetical protein